LIIIINPEKSTESYIYEAIQGVELTFGEGDILLGLPYDVHRIHLARGAVSAGKEAEETPSGTPRRAN
jgi:hypothetical protein